MGTLESGTPPCHPPPPSSNTSSSTIMTSRTSAQSRPCPGNQGCESKNSQDVGVGSKPGKSSGAGGGSSSFPKGSSRRREPSQGSLSGLNPQRPGPRTKGGPGKRPPPRGGHQNYPRENQAKTYRNYSTHQIDEADECELGSIFNPGSKKQNYNHLLNFYIIVCRKKTINLYHHIKNGTINIPIIKFA